MNVNFYIHDNAFERVYANPDRYLDHLRCFHSVCGLDYSIASGEQGMPFAMQIWNKYRNHALTYYLALNGVKMLYIQQQIQMKQKYRSSLKSQQITERMKQKKLST